ncbi:espin-like protein [Gavia stellata]|uniref:espin-like protein n=1 Tax=Gavia stellata TaxID=37040 RepID=UPI00289D73EB|nr:espin-like protein [Gavia stellata]
MEPSGSVPAELKRRKPPQRARIPAPFFAHSVGRLHRPQPPARPFDCPPPPPPEPPVTLPAQDGAAEPVDPPGPDPAEADADSLVPTHDERGRPIPEWKRQVMVRRLRAGLADEEAAGGQVRGGPGADGPSPQDAGSWRFSPSRQAVLGPFGELLTEADLRQLERAVESLRLRRRGEAYQGELRRLARELRALLPVPLLRVSVRSPPPAPGQPLPLCLRRAFEPARGAAEGKAAGGSGAEAASDSGIGCEEVDSDGGGGSPGPEWGSLRKERIVMLFLSHWRRSAYGPPPPAVGAPREAAGTAEGGAARLARQRAAIQRLLGGWRDAASRHPPPPPAAGRAPLSPEQFVARAGGGPADYESLSLELFMLGYFRILEQELSPEERRGRHLLCFELFEQLGRHGWRAVRAFHRAVTDEIAAGRRGWRDGFDDIKARYFGTPQNSARGGAGVEGEEICRYIDRSFAFWKEREAELFGPEG